MLRLDLRPPVVGALPATAAAAVRRLVTVRAASAAAAAAGAASMPPVPPPQAGTGAVFPERYEELLQDKIGRLRQLFAGQQLPELEVHRSEPSHFRSRAEFRLWHQGDDLFYVMYEKQDQAGGSDSAGAPAADDSDGGGGGASGTAAASASAAAGAAAAAEDAADADAAAVAADGAAPPAKKRRRKGGKGGGGGAAGGGLPPLPRRYPLRVRIDDFPIASRLICALMPLVRSELLAHEGLRRGVFQCNFHSSLSGQAVVTLVYKRSLDDAWLAEAEGLRARLLGALGPGACNALSVIGRSRKQKLVAGVDYVVEKMDVAGRQYEYMQVEGAFSQPNGGMCQQMLNWAVGATRGAGGDLLELYCGNGNFTLPLAQNFGQVVATEVSKASVAAARHNIAANGVSNVLLARMSSEEFTETWRTKGSRQRLAGLDWDALRLDTLFVDPPRAGLDPDTVQLLRAFERVVYISCNPETLAANLASVADSHEIHKMAVFDQFPYTEHLEAGALLVRRPQAAS